MSKNRINKKKNNQQSEGDLRKTKSVSIPLNLSSISAVIAIFGAIFAFGRYVGKTYSLIQYQDEKHQLQCEIIQLKEQIVVDKESRQLKEEELLTKVRILTDENSQLKNTLYEK